MQLQGRDRLAEFSLDIHLPWDKYLTKEFLPYAFRRRISHRCAAWVSLVYKLNGNQKETPDEKDLVLLLKSTMHLAGEYKDAVSRNAMYAALKDVVRATTSENQAAIMESMVLKNAVKYFEKIVKTTLL